MSLGRIFLGLALGLLCCQCAFTQSVDGGPPTPPPSDDANPTNEAPAFPRRVPISSLIWQGPALDAGPGGSEEAVEYGMARLLPTVGSSKPGGPNVTFGGLIQADAGWFNQSTSSRLTVGDVQDAAGLRRARFNAFGSVSENIDFRMALDFAAPGRPSFVDTFLDFTKIPLLGTIRVGQFRQPEGLEVMTAQRFGVFMERSSNILLMPVRRIGIGTFNRTADGRATWFVSAYRTGTDQYADDLNDNGAYASIGRMTWLPWDGDYDRYLHLGVSFGFSGATSGKIQYGRLGGNSPEWGLFAGTIGTPEFANSTPSFVNTNQFAALNSLLSNFEMAWTYGPLMVQGEFTTSQVNRPEQPYAFFPAYYGQISWFLSGEHHPYNRNLGVMDRVVPRTNSAPGNPFGGAWEIAARISSIDLTSENINGGKLTDGTIGLSWYANPYTRLYFNFIHSFLQKDPIGPSNANVFAMRAQLDF